MKIKRSVIEETVREVLKEYSNLGEKEQKLKNLLEKRDVLSALKLLYEWTKSGHINFREYRSLTSALLNYNLGEDEWNKI